MDRFSIANKDSTKGYMSIGNNDVTEANTNRNARPQPPPSPSEFMSRCKDFFCNGFVTYSLVIVFFCLIGIYIYTSHHTACAVSSNSSGLMLADPLDGLVCSMSTTRCPPSRDLFRCRDLYERYTCTNNTYWLDGYNGLRCECPPLAAATNIRHLKH